MSERRATSIYAIASNWKCCITADGVWIDARELYKRLIEKFGPDAAKHPAAACLVVYVTQDQVISVLTPEERAPRPSLRPMTCDCSTWAVEDFRRTLLGNGHHPHCQHFIPEVGAVDLIADLVDGINEWAGAEDGVPEWLWEAYSRAVFITKGFMPNPVG